LRDQGLERFFVHQLRLQRNRFDAPITIPSYGFVRFRGRTAVVNHQSVTTVCQRIRDVSANAAFAGAGDQGYFSGVHRQSS